MHVPPWPIMHAFIRSPANSRAGSTGKQNKRHSPLSLPPSLSAHLRQVLDASYTTGMKKRKDPRDRKTSLTAVCESFASLFRVGQNVSGVKKNKTKKTSPLDQNVRRDPRAKPQR